MNTFLTLLAHLILAAHATLTSSEPAKGAALDSSPPRVRLVFSEPVVPRLGRIAIITTDGRRDSLSVEGDPRNVRAIIAVPRVLPSGSYRVVWSVVSADGHPIKGEYTFRVVGDTTRADSVPPVALPSADTTPSAAAGDPSQLLPGPPVGAALFRGLGIGALMALAGLLSFAMLSRTAMSNREHRLAVTLAVAAPVLLGAHLMLWLINIAPEHRLGGAFLSGAMGTMLGKVEVVRVGLAFLALWALALARRPAVALAFAAASVLVSGAVGHSAAIQPEWAIPAKALHLAAVALWFGGLLWLLVANRSDSKRFVHDAGRVSSIALIAVIVALFTGVVQTRLFLPALGDLVRSGYGLLVLAKVAGFAILVMFGAYHRYRVLPRLEQAGEAAVLARSVRREVGVMTLIVLIGGLLAYVPPPEPARPPGQAISVHSP